MQVIQHGVFEEINIEEYVLNSTHLTVGILNIGASIYRLLTPDADGNVDDIVLGFDDLRKYLRNVDSFGALTGRFANRIGGAVFFLDGKRYLLTADEGKNCLHGGLSRLSQKIFKVESFSANNLTLSCESPDGDSGFPGHLRLQVSYTLGPDSLEIVYTAQSDADTVINISNHSYFNLGGHNSGSILEHELLVNSKAYMTLDEQLLPKTFENTAATPFDFNKLTSVAHSLGCIDPQIRIAGGLDHSFLLHSPYAARLVHPYNGRVLECHTSEPVLHIYTANHIDGMPGKDGAYYGKFPAICLESQHLANSPNRPDFPSTTLRAGAIFKSTTVYKFSTLEFKNF